MILHTSKQYWQIELLCKTQQAYFIRSAIRATKMSAVNLYTASEKDLRTLHSIGPASAQKIIELRDQESLSFQALAFLTRIPEQQWHAWLQQGIISMVKPQITQEESADCDGTEDITSLGPKDEFLPMGYGSQKVPNHWDEELETQKSGAPSLTRSDEEKEEEEETDVTTSQQLASSNEDRLCGWMTRIEQKMNANHQVILEKLDRHDALLQQHSMQIDQLDKRMQQRDAELDDWRRNRDSEWTDFQDRTEEIIKRHCESYFMIRSQRPTSSNARSPVISNKLDSTHTESPMSAKDTIRRSYKELGLGETMPKQHKADSTTLKQPIGKSSFRPIIAIKTHIDNSPRHTPEDFRKITNNIPTDRVYRSSEATNMPTSSGISSKAANGGKMGQIGIQEGVLDYQVTSLGTHPSSEIPALVPEEYQTSLDETSLSWEDIPGMNKMSPREANKKDPTSAEELGLFQQKELRVKYTEYPSRIVTNEQGHSYKVPSMPPNAGSTAVPFPRSRLSVPLTQQPKKVIMDPPQFSGSPMEIAEHMYQDPRQQWHHEARVLPKPSFPIDRPAQQIKHERLPRTSYIQQVDQVKMRSTRPVTTKSERLSTYLPHHGSSISGLPSASTPHRPMDQHGHLLTTTGRPQPRDPIVPTRQRYYDPQEYSRQPTQLQDQASYFPQDDPPYSGRQTKCEMRTPYVPPFPRIPQQTGVGPTPVPGAAGLVYNYNYPIQMAPGAVCDIGSVAPPNLPQELNRDRTMGTARAEPDDTDTSSDSGDDPHAPVPLYVNRSVSSRHGNHLGRPERVRLPVPKLPQFDGTMGEWDNFMFQFNNVCEYYRLDKTGKLQQLKGCLTGKAINFVRTLPPRTCRSYRLLTARLQERFAGIERADVLRRDLQDIKQRIDEPIDEFADRVQTQVSLAYRGFPLDIINTSSTEIFLRGAKDRQSAYETAKGHPANIQQALSNVKNHSSLLKSIMGRSSLPSSRHVSFLEENVSTRQASTEIRRPLTPPPQLMTTAVQTERSPLSTRDQLRSPPRSPQRRSRPNHDRCFNCDEYGHFRAECPKLQDSPKANGRQ